MGPTDVARWTAVAFLPACPLSACAARALLVAPALPVEQAGVGPQDELVERVIRQQGGQAHGDPDPNGILERLIDRSEPALHAFRIDSAQPAHELVPAVADNRVEGPQIGPEGCSQCPEHVIACGVPIPVVDALQSIDVDEGDDEAAIAPPCAVNLVGERKPTHLASVQPSQVVETGTA